MKITIDLSDLSSAKRAADEVRKYQEWLRRGVAELVKQVAARGVEIATVSFANAEVSGINDATVTALQVDDTHIEVKASGESVLFIEFGTGLGMGDHPERPAEFYPGSYGKGYGADPNGWKYVGSPGSNPPAGTYYEKRSDGKWLVTTMGNPANACMYNTVQQLLQELPGIVQDCFRR